MYIWNGQNIHLDTIMIKIFVSSDRRALASKLRVPGFKSRPGTLGGPLTIIMWGAQPGWKLALS